MRTARRLDSSVLEASKSQNLNRPNSPLNPGLKVKPPRAEGHGPVAAASSSPAPARSRLPSRRWPKAATGDLGSRRGWPRSRPGRRPFRPSRALYVASAPADARSWPDEGFPSLRRDRLRSQGTTGRHGAPRPPAGEPAPGRRRAAPASRSRLRAAGRPVGVEIDQRLPQPVGVGVREVELQQGFRLAREQVRMGHEGRQDQRLARRARRAPWRRARCARRLSEAFTGSPE